MAQRVYMSGNPPRLITSKPGFNASPSLEDINKTFDSEWFNGGGIKFKLKVPSSETSVSFPYALSYVPTVVAFRYITEHYIDEFWAGASHVGPNPPSYAQFVVMSGGATISTTGISGFSSSATTGNRIFLVMEA